MESRTGERGSVGVEKREGVCCTWVGLEKRKEEREAGKWGSACKKLMPASPAAPRRAGCGVGVPTLTFVKSGAKQRLGALTGAFFTHQRPKKRLGASWGP